MNDIYIHESPVSSIILSQCWRGCGGTGLFKQRWWQFASVICNCDCNLAISIKFKNVLTLRLIVLLLKIYTIEINTPVFLGFPCGSAGQKSACSEGDLGSIPGLGWSAGEGEGYPLQRSGLENSMDFTVYSIVHGVTKSQTGLSDFHFHFQISM